MFNLLKRKGETGDQGFTLLETALAVGLVLLLSTLGILSYGKIQRNAEIAAVETSAAQGYTAAMSGVLSAAQIEADLTTADVTVSVYNLSSPLAKTSTARAGIQRAATITAAAYTDEEPCVVAEGYEYTATRGACDDIEGGGTGGEEGPGDDGGSDDGGDDGTGGGGVGDDLRSLREVFQLFFTSEDTARFAGQAYTATIKDSSGTVIYSEKGVASRSGTAELFFEQSLNYVVKLDGSTVLENGKSFAPRAYAPTYTVGFDFGSNGTFSETLKTSASMLGKDDRWFDHSFNQYAEGEAE